MPKISILRQCQEYGKEEDPIKMQKRRRIRCLTCLSVFMVLVSALCMTAYFLLNRPLKDVVLPKIIIPNGLPSVKVVANNVVEIESGKIVKLRGVNIGGWFAPESWMSGYKGLVSDWSYYAVADARWGEDKSRELFQIWNENFVTETDFNMIAAQGFNFVRFPLHFRNFQYGNTSWIRKADGSIAWDEMDKFITMAGRYGIYVQLDLRVWNGRDIVYEGISKADPTMTLEETAQSILWRSQAVDFIGNLTEHLIGNPNVLGIDAINEPVPSYGDTLMTEMYYRIRSVDPDRMFIREFGVDRNDPVARGWVNVMHSFHVYPNFTGRPFTLDEFKREVNDRISDNFTIPYQAGEFQLSPQDYLEGVKFMESKNINWAIFTFKAVKQNTWAFFNYDSDSFVDFSKDSFEKIKSTWQTKLGNMNYRKSKSALADAMLDNASFNW